MPCHGNIVLDTTHKSLKNIWHKMHRFRWYFYSPVLCCGVEWLLSLANIIILCEYIGTVCVIIYSDAQRYCLYFYDISSALECWQKAIFDLLLYQIYGSYFNVIRNKKLYEFRVYGVTRTAEHPIQSGTISHWPLFR